MNGPWSPTRKVGGGAAVGLPLSVILVWAVEAFTTVTIPGEVATAIGSLLTFVASYLISDDD